AKVVETAFADRYDFGLVREPFELMGQFFGQLRGVMWMNSGGRVERSRMRVRERDGFPRALTACAGHDHLHDSSRCGTGHHRVPIAVITVMREVDADIHQCG